MNVIDYNLIFRRLQRKEDKTDKERQYLNKLAEWQDKELRGKGVNIC